MKYQKMVIVAAFLLLLASCGQQIKPPTSQANIAHPPHEYFDPATYDSLASQYQNPTTRIHDDNFTYLLPFSSGSTFQVTQGYYGGFSHQNVAALDFGMPEGTEIRAIRAGTILNAVDGRDWDPSCYLGGSCLLANGNYVVVGHSDGSRAYYLHMRKSSITVSINQTVIQGQALGVSGATGNTCGNSACTVPGAHLHLQVYTDTTGTSTSKTKFKEIIEAGRADGYAVALDSYTSQNSGVVNPCPPTCPPVTLTNEMIGKAGATTALNFNLGDNVFNLFTTNSSDPDQLWDIFKPGDFGGNPGWMIRRKGTNICLNFYRPNLGNGVYPNPYTCSASDGDQQFDFIDKGMGTTGREWQIRVQGTNYCLDTANWASLARVYAYSCLETANQHWIIPAAPDPIVPPAWSVTPTTMTFTGTVGGATPAAQSFTIRNNGGAGTFASFSSDDAWLSATGFSTTVAAGSSTTGSALMVVPCSTPGTTNGTLRFVTGSSTTTISVTRVCNGVSFFTPSTSSLILPAGIVGGATSSNTFSLQNTGTASGTYTLSATNSFTVNPATGVLANGSGATITVTAPACTAAGTLTSSVSIAGSTSTVSVSRVCTVPLPAIPAIPTGMTLNVSSNGRIFASWNESTGADQYEFTGTFDTSALVFGSPVNARGSGVSAAVLVWDLNPSDTAKQGKQLCVQIRAKNTGGSSNYATSVCTTYKYYSGVSLKSSNPVVTISLP